MKSIRLPFQIFGIRTTNKFISPFSGIFQRVEKFVPGLKYDLVKSDLEVTPTEYVGFCFFNSIFMFIVAFVFLFPLSFVVAGRPLLISIEIGLGSALLIFFMMFYIMLRYPSVTAGKISEQIDKNLVYGLKDLLLQLSSGIPLYNAISNVAEANYGQISTEFSKVSKNIKTGMPVVIALEKMAVETKSKFLKRTVWQMVNSIKAGSSVKGALQSVILELMNEQRNSIMNYAKELNLWTLIYMMFAVAIPSIGGTLLIVLSSFAGAGISKSSFVLFLALGFIVQIGLIEFIKSRRPVINL